MPPRIITSGFDDAPVTGFVYSSPDMLGLVYEINKKIGTVFGAEFAAHRMFTLSDELVELLKNARQLHSRYLHGDYRHTERELGKLITLAMRMIQTQAEAKGFSPRYPKFAPEDLSAKQLVAAGMYAEVIAKSDQQWA